MNNISKRTNKDYEYINHVDSILGAIEFNKIKDISHHGITRYDHSLRVSYLSYKIAKLFKCNTNVAARGGLLHDFFIEKEEKKNLNSVSLLSKHPSIAKNNAINIFDVDEKVQNIIGSHMFPLSIEMPKYKEAWIVTIADKIVSISELSKEFNAQLTLWTLFLINFIR